MNSTTQPSRYFSTHRQCFAAFRLTWLAYSDGRKSEYCSVWKDRIIVASTCRRSVQFGCYITWPWMENWVSVMIKMLPLFNFTISCHGRLAWKTSRCACALGGSRFWLVESTLFGDHVSRAGLAYYYGRSGTCHGPRALGAPRAPGENNILCSC